MDVIGNSPEIPGQEVNVGSLEEKPWRKAGANISDYFNYGFDEESWKAYCKKQKKLDKKIMVQKGHTTHGEEEPWCFPPSSDNPFIRASRNRSSCVFIDKTGKRPKPSSNVKGYQYQRSKGKYIQVVTETPSDEDGIPSCQQCLPSNFTYPSAFIPLQPFLYARMFPVSNAGTRYSGRSGFDDPSRYMPCSSGAVRGSAGVIDTAKTREYCLRQGMEGNSGHEKERKRRNDRGNKNSPHNSGEERMRHRDTMERRHKRHSFERFSGGKGGQYRERRHGGENEELLYSSCSNSRGRRDDVQDRDSLRRQEHKKAKRH